MGLARELILGNGRRWRLDPGASVFADLRLDVGAQRSRLGSVGHLDFLSLCRACRIGMIIAGRRTSESALSQRKMLAGSLGLLCAPCRRVGAPEPMDEKAKLREIGGHAAGKSLSWPTSHRALPRGRTTVRWHTGRDVTMVSRACRRSLALMPDRHVRITDVGRSSDTVHAVTRHVTLFQ